MAKKTEPSALPETLPPPPPAGVPPTFGLVAARARRALTLTVDGATVRVLGGEWITDPAHLDAVGAGAFGAYPDVELFRPANALELEALQADYARAEAHVRARAADLGLVVHRHGEVP
jgi:hypothetical protein